MAIARFETFTELDTALNKEPDQRQRFEIAKANTHIIAEQNPTISLKVETLEVIIDTLAQEYRLAFIKLVVSQDKEIENSNFAFLKLLNKLSSELDKKSFALQNCNNLHIDPQSIIKVLPAEMHFEIIRARGNLKEQPQFRKMLLADLQQYVNSLQASGHFDTARDHQRIREEVSAVADIIDKFLQKKIDNTTVYNKFQEILKSFTRDAVFCQHLSALALRFQPTARPEISSDKLKETKVVANVSRIDEVFLAPSLQQISRLPNTNKLEQLRLENDDSRQKQFIRQLVQPIIDKRSGDDSYKANLLFTLQLKIGEAVNAYFKDADLKNVQRDLRIAFNTEEISQLKQESSWLKNMLAGIAKLFCLYDYIATHTNFFRTEIQIVEQDCIDHGVLVQNSLR